MFFDLPGISKVLLKTLQNCIFFLSQDVCVFVYGILVVLLFEMSFHVLSIWLAMFCISMGLYDIGEYVLNACFESGSR